MFRVNTTQSRDASVDIFRGLTIFLMIWVNDLAGVTGIPGWLKHFPADGNGMTFVDIVFPAFLFISGMSIPLALKKGKYAGITGELPHIGKRGFSLIVIGVLMVNIGSVHAGMTGMNKYQWGLLVLTGIILLFNSRFKGKSGFIIKLAGLFMILFCIYIFRGGNAENPVWLRTQWWGIIGLIGWAYIVTALLYTFAGRNLLATGAGMTALLLLNIADWSGLFGIPGSPDLILRPGIQIGGHGFIMCAGLFLGLLKETYAGDGSGEKFYIAAAIFTALLFVCGYLLAPGFGINKNDATAAWCLYSAAWSVIVYMIVFAAHGKISLSRPALIISAAGANALLAYLLPDIWYFILHESGIKLWSIYNEGIAGILRSTVFAAVFIMVAAYLHTMNFRLKV